jgi:hypothetical protein
VPADHVVANVSAKGFTGSEGTICTIKPRAIDRRIFRPWHPGRPQWWRWQ